MPRSAGRKLTPTTPAPPDLGLRTRPDETDDTEAGGSWQVYFLSLVDPANPDHDFGLVKVGNTEKDIEERIEQLQTGNPYQLRCERSFRSPVARQIEHFVHRTSQVVQLEWLRLARSEIPDLVKKAQQEGERLARIEEARARWSHSESNDMERQPGAEEGRLHEEVRGILAELWPVKLRLELTRTRIALQAGKVLRIPGIVTIWHLPSSGPFNSKTACEKFPDLAAAHTIEEVDGTFQWLETPTRGSPECARLREEVKHLRKQQRELDAAMLNNDDWLRKEGERTDDLAHLHDEYLGLIRQNARLELDEEYIQAQAIQAIEDFDRIAGVCSFRRSKCLVLNNKSFCQAHSNEAAQCTLEREAHIRRRIYTSRSY